MNGAFDPREATFNRFDTWYGEPQMKQATLFANAANPLGDGVKLYGWASFQNRDAKSAANIRRAVQDQNIASIYPDGFIPFIEPNVKDYAMTGGVNWVMGDWDMDASLGYGSNEMQFDLTNTLNRSIGPTSKTDVLRRRLRLRPAGAERVGRARDADGQPGFAIERGDRRRSAARRLHARCGRA